MSKSRIKLLRKNAASDRDAAIGSFFGAEVWIRGRHEFRADERFDLLLALGGLGVDVALVTKNSLACCWVDAGEFIGHDAAAVIVESDLGIIDEVFGTGHGSHADASGFGLIWVVDPISVIVEILAELFF